MLQIVIPDTELYNEATEEFIQIKGQTLQLEHSLVSLSKWESKWYKPFLTKAEKTLEESLDYIRCMTITQNVNPDVYKYIKADDMLKISNYIENPMTATVFSEDDSNKKINKEIITAEIIYYWMVAYNIPFECQKWHLNKLLTLINVCNIKNQPAKKMDRKTLLTRNAALNEARKESLKTKG